MGMDLKPIDPADHAPVDKNGNPVWGRYNWFGWNLLQQYLGKWGVDTSELTGLNDGAEISEETCIEIAKAIMANADELIAAGHEGFLADAALWGTCGGYEQW